MYRKWQVGALISQKRLSLSRHVLSHPPVLSVLSCLVFANTFGKEFPLIKVRYTLLYIIVQHSDRPAKYYALTISALRITGFCPHGQDTGYVRIALIFSQE